MINVYGFSIRQLQVFDAVARQQSYARVEQELGISISAISNSMSQLEQLLGFSVCQRGRGGFSLTDKGQHFLQQTMRVLHELSELERRSSEMKKEQRGTISLSALDSIETETVFSLPMVLRRFCEKYPKIHIRLTIATPQEQISGVLENRIDLAIGSYTSLAHNLINEPLHNEQHWLYCGDLHPLYAQRYPDKAEVTRCPLVSRSYWTAGDLSHQGFSQGSATVETVDAQLLLILTGKYIGYLPEHYALPWIKQHRLRVIMPGEFGFQSHFSAIVKRGRSHEPCLRVLRCLLKDAVQLSG